MASFGHYALSLGNTNHANVKERADDDSVKKYENIDWNDEFFRHWVLRNYLLSPDASPVAVVKLLIPCVVVLSGLG